MQRTEPNSTAGGVGRSGRSSPHASSHCDAPELTDTSYDESDESDASITIREPPTYPAMSCLPGPDKTPKGFVLLSLDQVLRKGRTAQGMHALTESFLRDTVEHNIFPYWPKNPELRPCETVMLDYRLKSHQYGALVQAFGETMEDGRACLGCGGAATYTSCVRHPDFAGGRCGNCVTADTTCCFPAGESPGATPHLTTPRSVATDGKKRSAAARCELSAGDTDTDPLLGVPSAAKRRRVRASEAQTRELHALGRELHSTAVRLRCTTVGISGLMRSIERQGRE